MRHARSIAAALGSALALLAACEPPPPAPASPPAPPAPPAPRAEAPLPLAASSGNHPAASSPPGPSPAAPDASAAPSPSAEAKASYPKGVVDAELLGRLEADLPPPPPPLSRAASCSARLRASARDGEGCEFQPLGILGFQPTKGVVAVLLPESNDRHDDCDRVRLTITSLEPSPLERGRVPAHPRTPECPRGAWTPSVTAELASTIAKEGFVDASELVKLLATDVFGSWGFKPVAALKAPLRDHLLRASSPSGREIVVELIAPDNKTTRRLGSVPLGETTCVLADDKGGCAERSTFKIPSVLSASLSPDKKHLVVLLKLNSPAPHDTQSRHARAIFKLPDGVLP